MAAFFGPSELAAVREIVSEPQRPAAFSYFEAEQPVGIVVGRAVGAAHFSLAHFLPFLIDGLSYLFCVFSLRVVRGDFSAQPPEPGERPGRALDGV